MTPARYLGQPDAPRFPVPKAMAPKVLEKHVADACDKLASELGWTTERYEQRRASMICEGLPDRRYIHPRGMRIWVELKAPKGKLTEAQYAWLVSENRAQGLAVVIDSAATLARLLNTLNRQSSIANVAVRHECDALISLTAQRGFRAPTIRRRSRLK